MNTSAPETNLLGPATTAPTAPIVTVLPRKSTKKRVRHFSSEDRAAHRIFEKGRREAFKERLTELAGQLPVLADTDPKQLSKHVVVDESISRHRLLESLCVDALRDIRSLVQERDELLAEINMWRRNAGTSPWQQERAINVEGLVKIEKESHRRASAVRLYNERKKFGQIRLSSDDRTQAANGADKHAVKTSHVPQTLPVEMTQDAQALSDLDSLLLDTSWSQVTQAPPVAFPTEDSITTPNQPTAIRSDGLPDSLSTPKPGVDDYRIFGNISLHQQMPLLNMDSTEFHAPDTVPFTESYMPLSSGYLAAANLNQGLSLQQLQQWVSWHG